MNNNIPQNFLSGFSFLIFLMTQNLPEDILMLNIRYLKWQIRSMDFSRTPQFPINIFITQQSIPLKIKHGIKAITAIRTHATHHKKYCSLSILQNGKKICIDSRNFEQIKLVKMILKVEC
jgi:hypothetical protein